MVKTALLFSLENFQNCVVSRGRLGSQPPLSHHVTPETSPWPGYLINVLSRILSTHSIFTLVFFTSIFPFHYHFFHFNLYPNAINVITNVLHKCRVIACMQSAFTIRKMDSTTKPPSTNMAANEPKQRKLRKCTNCTSRMPSFLYDNHTLCTKCRNQVCNINLICYKCHDWIIMKRKTFVHYNNKLRIKR